MNAITATRWALSEDHLPARHDAPSASLHSRGLGTARQHHPPKDQWKE
jgi:hypothetical protein